MKLRYFAIYERFENVRITGSLYQAQWQMGATASHALHRGQNKRVKAPLYGKI